ncbi:uncharacterized protein I303_104403 [Kwoniella dejecticola CBS 10117]|uniref:Uncharacterized protein n=1 Tax=Kwoniella dejecticola CBS 10117 TaxID=1296121 RepID=A0A1A6A5G1_9TREE|nr:uncharacterized protein I303_04618 [Kwoniella dejecticola CBS 10117]OBR85285.1 hypothetical protein I303_04618 [Kwoniella dejecticola CBS 10117]
MFSKTTLLTLAAVATSALGADLTISTPASLIQCQPALLSWTGGTAPYYLAVIPGGQPSAAALQDLGEQQGNSLTWTVNVAAGQSITLKVTDSTGVVNYNQAVTIQEGSSSACLTAAATSSAASASTPAAVSTATAAAAVTSGASSAGAMSSAGSASSAAASKASSAVASGASAASSARSSGSAAAASAAASASASAGSGAMSRAVVNGGLVAVAAGVIGLAFA